MKHLHKIVVYLDTSDFVRLYRQNLSRDEQQIKSFLLKKVECGDIIIPNSYAIMTEFIQDFSDEFEEDRLRRARFIKKLCGKYAFQYYPTRTSSNILNKAGAWTPRVHFDIDKIIKEISRHLASNPNTVSYARDLLHPRKRILLAKNNKDLFRSIDSSAIKSEKSIIERIYSENILRNFLLKKISRNDINKLVSKIINDPEIYITDVHKHDPLLKSSMDILHESSQKIQNAIDRILRYIESQKPIIDKLTKQKEELLSSGISTEQKREVKRIHRNLLREFDPQKMCTCKASTNSFYFSQFLYDVLNSYLLAHLTDPSLPWRRSDAGDILHSLFIPHVDLWRGDGAFSSILIAGNIKYNERIVSKLLDLPDRIETLQKNDDRSH